MQTNSNNNNQDKLVALAKKLQALAERGVGGEQQNAAKMLANLIDKYNIVLGNDDDLPSQHEYLIKTVHKQLFFAIVWNSIANWDGRYKTVVGKKTIIRLNCTEMEHLEITAKFDMYVKDYDKQRRMFTDAYIVKNRLFSIGDNPNVIDAASTLSDADLDTIMSLAHGIKRTVYRKQLDA